MADRYWVGGTGTWDASTTTNWSATSGGAGGASAPTSADNVFFNANSDAGAGFTVTISTNAVCNDITVSGLDQVMTLAGSAAWRIHGSLSFPATNLTFTHSGAKQFLGSATGKTITTNGVSLVGTVDLNGVGSEWTLGSAYTNTNGNLNLTAGSLVTAGFNITTPRVFKDENQSFSLNLSSSIITVTTQFTYRGLNASINSGTSEIVCTAANVSFDGNGLTFYNVSFTSTASGTHTITGANTFNNLTFNSLAATGIRNISISDNQTVNGTLTLGTANTAIRRMFMYSNVVGTNRTITANAIATLEDVDFRDITAAGASGTWSGTRLGNCLGNSNITFDAGKTVYYNDTNGGTWTDTAWALSSGGAVNVNNFPLAQDTVIFDNTGWTSGSLGTNAFWNYGTLDFSSLTNSVTFATGGQISYVYGDIILSPSLSISGSSIIFFNGNNKTQTITSAGKTFTQSLTVNNVTGVLQLQDALSTSNTFTLTQGTLDLNNFDLTCNIFSSSNTNTRSIAFGTGQLNIAGNNATVWQMTNATGFTHTGTPTVNLTYSGSVGSRGASHGNTAGGTEANAVTINTTGGTDIVALSGFFVNLNFTGFAGNLTGSTRSLFGNLVLSSGMILSATASTTTFGKTSGTQTATCNGNTMDFPIAKSGAGPLQLLDTLTLGSTRTFSLTSGTLNLDGKTLSTGLFNTNNGNVRTLDFGTGGVLQTTGTGTVFNAGNSTNLTVSGTGKVSVTGSDTKTFSGGGATYPTLEQAGSGTLTIAGANTFANITNTNPTATTIIFPNSTTTVADFTASGSAGNVLTLQRTGASGFWTINKTGGGVINVDYVNVSNSVGTPSSTWYAGSNSVNGGGNTGWFFANPFPGNFILFF